MAKKDRRATEQLNVALSGIDSAITIALTNMEDGVARRALEKAREYADEARDALVSIQFHASQI